MNQSQAQGNQPVVQADALHRIYPISRGFLRASDRLQAVGGVSFSLQAGRTLAIVGESGCGKSTLARMVSLIEPPTSGTLHIGGVDAVAASGAERHALRQQVQLVFQNPYGSLNPRKRIGQILQAPLEINTTLTAPERAERALSMLALVGLREEHYERYPHMFSGGQRQRIAIARALMLKPALVVADEPVSALDVSIQAQILNLLSDLQRDLGLAYLFISHDLSVVRHVADETMVMYLGSVAEQGDTDTLFNAAHHPYTQALLSAIPLPDPVAQRKREKIILTGDLPSPLAPPPGCPFASRCPIRTDPCERSRPVLTASGPGISTACLVGAPSLATNGD